MNQAQQTGSLSEKKPDVEQATSVLFVNLERLESAITRIEERLIPVLNNEDTIRAAVPEGIPGSKAVSPLSSTFFNASDVVSSCTNRVNALLSSLEL